MLANIEYDFCLFKMAKIVSFQRLRRQIIAEMRLKAFKRLQGHFVTSSNEIDVGLNC